MQSESDTAGLRKALVVEDEHSIAMLIAAVAQRAGFSVDHANDGAEAVRAMDDQDYAVVVLDLMLPRVNGWQVLEHIEEKGCAGCVVIVSAGSDNDLAKVNASVVRKVIQKPFDVNELEQILASIHRDAAGAPIVASSERLKVAAKDEEKSRSGEAAPSESAKRPEVEERDGPE